MRKVLKYAFRITHIDNIPHILRCGLVRADSPMRDNDYVTIGDRQIIRVRGDKLVNGCSINNYIPFYFGPRSPMLYVIQHGYNGVKRVAPEKLIYCVIRLEDLVRDQIDCIFTDGHALSNLTSFYPQNKLAEIDTFVRYEDVYTAQWNSETDIDLKRRKEAELLVKNDLPIQYIKGYVVYSSAAKKILEDSGIATEMIAVVPSYYF